MAVDRQIYNSAAARRDLVEARLMTNGQHVRSFIGTYDGYVYARGTHMVLRRKEGETFWACFCGTEVWPAGANPQTVIAQQLAEAPYLNGPDADRDNTWRWNGVVARATSEGICETIAEHLDNYLTDVDAQIVTAPDGRTYTPVIRVHLVTAEGL